MAVMLNGGSREDGADGVLYANCFGVSRSCHPSEEKACTYQGRQPRQSSVRLLSGCRVFYKLMLPIGMLTLFFAKRRISKNAPCFAQASAVVG